MQTTVIWRELNSSRHMCRMCDVHFSVSICCVHRVHISLPEQASFAESPFLPYATCVFARSGQLTESQAGRLVLPMS